FYHFESNGNLQRLGSLKRTLSSNEMIPLEKLVAMNPGEILTVGSADETEKQLAETRTMMAFYAQSYALVRFLREDDYGKRLGNYHQLLLGGLRGDWQLGEPYSTIAADRNIMLTAHWNNVVGSQLFKRYIGNDFYTLEKEYTAFCRKLVYHIYFK
ncbi:MAG: hypothetical protein KAI25_16390, partial [Hyphomicrobiaceae bacterium]|nr:hypothetical protein [Hyphomicrobiaceae bacterium]